MKLFLMTFFVGAFCSAANVKQGFIKPASKAEQSLVVNEGINFDEWESEFDTSIKKAKVRADKCTEKGKKNCQFEKFQALDPSFDMVQ